MSKTNLINILSVAGAKAQTIVMGDYKEALKGKLVNKALLKEALGKGELGQVELKTINTALKPLVIDDVKVWFELLSTIEAKGFTRRAQVFQYLYEQGYFGIQFTDYVADILTSIDQPSIIRCTRKYGHVLFVVDFNKTDEVVTVTNITEEARANYAKTVKFAEYISANKAAKKQYDIKQVSINDLVQNKETKFHQLQDGKTANVVSTSTSVMFELAEEEGMDILVLDMSTLEFEGNDEKARQIKILNILSNGIEINGLVYYPLAQSASQSRTGKLYMGSKSPKEIEAFRDRISYGAFKKYKGKEVEVSKVESRITLASTNTVSVGHHEFDYTQIVKDMELSVSYRAKQIEEIYNAEGKVVNYVITETEVTNNNATDGASYIHPKKAAEFAYRLGLISSQELAYFTANYKSTKKEDVMGDAKLFRIFFKIPNVFQVRCGSIKGLVVMWDFDNELDGKHKGQSFVLHESIVKAIPDLTSEEQPEWRIANVNNKRWGRVRLSAQFMTVLEMDLADAVSLVKENLETIDKTILTDANEALRFVNAIVGTEEADLNVEEDGKELATKVAAALSANPQLIKDKWVRRQLRKLVEKTVTRLKYGAVNVDGIYAYAVTDPRAYFRATLNENGEFVSCEECLQSGQYFLNNKVGTVAGLRAPHIHNTESQLLDLVQDEELWYLSNLIVFNPFDMTAQASQGMDFDGDQMLITDDARIVRSIKRDDWMILQGLGREAKKHLWNMDSVLDLYASRSKRDNVGSLSNYALLFKEYKNHLVNMVKYNMYDAKDKAHIDFYIEKTEECIIKLACLIGAEIDKAKTGVAPVITDDLVAKVYPAWWIGFKSEIKGSFPNTPEAHEEYRAKLMKRGGSIFGENKCLTPVGACYSIVSKWQEENMKDFAGEAGSADLARTLAKDLYIEPVVALFDKVEKAMDNYTAEMRALQSKKDKMDEEAYEQALTDLYDRHQVQFDSISDDKVSVAAAAYIKANDNGKSNATPWVFCFDGLMTLFSKGTNTMLYAVPSYLTEGELVEADNGGLFINKRFAGETSLPCGRYGVQLVGGRPYVLATRKGQPKVKSNGVANPYQGTEILPVTVMGFDYNGTTATTFMNELNKANGIAEVHADAKGFLAVYVNDVKVASVTSKSVEVSAKMTSTRVQFVTKFVETTYVQKETGNTVSRKSLNLSLTILGSVEAKEVVIPTNDYVAQSYDEVYNQVNVEDMMAQFGAIDFNFVDQFNATDLAFEDFSM